MGTGLYKNTIWQVGDKIVAMLANLVVGIYLARTLGPHAYGSISFVLALYALVIPLAALGLNAIVTRELVNKPTECDSILSSVAVLRLLGAVAAALLLIVWAGFGIGFSGGAERWALVGLAMALLLQSFQFIEYYFHAKEHIKPIAITRTGLLVLFAVVKLLAVYFGAGVTQVILIFAFEYAVVGASYLVLLGAYRGPLRWGQARLGFAVQLVKQSSWLVLSGIAAIIYLKIDQVMLSSMLGHEVTGQYSVAARLSEVWYFLATAVVISAFPMLLRTKAQSDQLYQHKLQVLSDILCWFAVALSLGISFIALPLIIFLFGAQYAPAANILVVHIWASVFVFMRALASKWLLSEGFLKFSFLSHGLGAVVNVGINLWLIPSLGGLGAAIATLVAYIVASFLSFWLLSSTRPMAIIMFKSLIAPFLRAVQIWR